MNLDWLDENGNTPGWVELYNGSDSTIYLDAYSLAHRKSSISKWRFPDDSISPKSYKIVFCNKSGSENQEEADEEYEDGILHYRLHASWKLNSSGGTVFLMDDENIVVDSFVYPSLKPGISYGLKDASSYAYFDKPTPEQTNLFSEAFVALSDVVPLQKAGFYKDSLFVDIPVDEVDGDVRCTQDGSSPTLQSEKVESVILIKENTILRCAAFKDGVLTKTITTQSFFINEKIGMPVVSISVDPVFFENHYYDLPENCESPCKKAGFWDDVEFPAHVEFFESGSASEKKNLEFDAGISIAGNNSRCFPKKSVALKIKERYQDQWVKYPFFDLHPENRKFKSLMLRNFGNRYRYDFLGNAAFSYMLEGTGVDFQRSYPVVVFYNGEYYGIHELSEKLNDHYIETNYGIDDKDVVMVKHTPSFLESDQDTIEYAELLNFIDTANFKGAQNKNYEYVKSRMDVNNLAMYLAFEIYGRNMDWPNNNVRVWKSSKTKWKYVAFDLDFAFGFEMQSVNFKSDYTMFDWIRRKKRNHGFANIYDKLIKNPDFKRLFINNSAILFNSFVYSEKLTALVEDFSKSIPESEKDRDLKRFVREQNVLKGFEHVKSWGETRSESVWDEYMEEFKLSGFVDVSVKSKGRGVIYLDGFKLPSSTMYTDFTGRFIKGNKMLLEAVPVGNASFGGWEDGNMENPRLVNPSDGDTFVAEFK